MQKFLQMIALVALLMVPGATRAQLLADYTFATGVDSTLWVDMSSATQILTPSGNDGLASAVQNIGFSFPFGGSTYTQYSVNTDGNLRLGSTATGTGSYSSPFSSSAANTNNPKINAFGCDGYGVSTIHYVKSLFVEADSMLAVEFCMGTFTNDTRNELYLWQIHLFANGTVRMVFPASDGIPATAPAVSRQCGLCVNSSAGFTVSATHQATLFTNGTSTTIPSGNWPDAGRYYEFAPSDCIGTGIPTVSGLNPYGFTATWTASSTAASYVVWVNNESPVDVSDDLSYTFTDLTPDHDYTFYVAAVCDDGDTSAYRSVNIHTLPSCAVLTDVNAYATTAAAMITWTPSASDEDCQGLVEYRQVGDSVWGSTINVTGTSITLSSLPLGTAFEARVAALCSNGDTSNWQTVTFSTGQYACAEFDTTNISYDTIGTGTATNQYIPSYSFYNYSYTQQIFTASEMGGAGPIVSISVMPSAVTSQRTFEIYMGHVNVATATSFLDPADLTLVYSGGQIPMTANEWLTFPLDQAFSYNGSDNLLVVFRDMTGSYTSGNYWKGTTMTSGVSRYVYRDASAYDVPPTGGSTGSFRANTIFTKADCLSYATCANPVATVTAVDSSSVTVSWIPGGEESSWDLLVRQGATGDFANVATESGTSYTFTGLEPGTEYFFRVAHQCDGVNYYSEVSAFTDCTPVSRLREDFENYATGSSGEFNVCWTKGRQGTTTNYPYVNTINGHKGMYFYSYYGTSSQYFDWVVTPAFVDSLNTLNVEFDLYRSSTTNYYTAQLVVGALTDPNDISTLDTIEVIEYRDAAAAGAWIHNSVSLANYHGEGQYIVFLAPAVTPFAATYSYNTFYIDNIYIESSNGCPHPTRFHARGITSTDAELAWDDNELYENVTVKWGTVNNIVDALDSAQVLSGNFQTLTGLTPGTTYYCWIEATCQAGTSFVMSTSFTTAASCGSVIDLTINDLGNNAATFSWNNNEISPAASYVFAWKAASATVWDSVTTTNTFYMLGGLSEGTAYEVSVRAICSESGSMPVTLSFNTTTNGTLGSDDGTSYLPTYPYYNHSISEQLWLASELSVYSDTIYGIYFNAASAISGRPMELWVGNTTLSNLSTSAFVPSSSMTLVFDTTINITAGWNYFEFDTPFVRDANSNFVVMAHDAEDYESFNGWVASNSAINSLYGYDDNSDFSTTDLSGLTEIAARAQMRLGATLVPVTCVAPHPVIADATSSSLTVAWMHGMNETSWVVEYRPVADTNWTLVAAVSTDTFATVTGLDAASRYIFRIGSICGSDTMYAAIIGTTSCGAFTVPYSEDFNTMNSNDYVMNPCWIKGTTGTGDTPYTVNITNEGMMSVLPRGSYIIFPEMDQPLNTLQLRMRYLTANTSIFAVVGVCDYPGDIQSFTPVDTIWAETAGAGTWVTVPFDSYEGTTGNIAIYSWFNQSYIDDVNIELMPMCSSVESLTVSNITTTTADVTWEPATNASSYIVEYYPYGSNTVITASTAVPSYTLSGLHHSTTYFVSVRTVCASLGDTSLATNLVTFVSECDVVEALPYVMNFDSCNVPALTYTGVLPNCWTYALQATGTYAGANYLPQIYSDNSYAHSGHYSLRLAGRAIVLLPEMPVQTDSLMISFHEYNTSTGYYGLIIGVCDSNTPGFEASFVPVDTLTFTQAHTDVTSYNLASYTGTGRYIGFRNFYITSATTEYSYHYIDDIVVDYVPSCMPVIDLHAAGSTQTSVDLVWTDLSVASEWQVSRATQPLADPLTGTLEIATANPWTVAGLSGDTTYYFYVRPICSVGDTGMWSPVFSVRPGSWNMRANQTDTLTLCGGTIYDDGGVTGNYSGNQNSTIVLMPSAGTIVSVSGSSYTEGSFDYMTIYDGIGTSGTQLWSDYGVSSLTAFGPIVSTDGPLTITFHSDGSVFYSGFEINVSCVSNACPISDIHVNASLPLTSTSLPLAWTGSSSAYDVKYGISGFDPDTEGTLLTTTTNSIVINGLTSLTTYDVYVRGYCDPDTSRWFRFRYTMPICDNPTMASTGAATSTSYYAPVNNYYRYTLSETIIDSAELAGIGDITTIAYSYHHTTPSSSKSDVTIWLQPTTKSSFASSSDVVALDSATAVQVYSGNLNCSQGWNYFAFDTAYTWNGHSNLLVIVDDNSYAYDGSAFTFDATSSTDYKTLVYYSDSNNPDPTDPSSFSGSKAYYQYRPTLQLVSCGTAAYCADPVINLAATEIGENDITVRYLGEADEYELGIVDGANWIEPAATYTTSDTFYTFNGLTAATQYTLGVRSVCAAGVVSAWSYVTLTTAEHPCFVPTGVTVSGATYDGGTISWTAGENETAWEVSIVSTAVDYDNVFPVNVTPTLTVDGLQAGIAYSVTVRAVCDATHYSDWTEPIMLTTLECDQVTGVAASEITANSVKISWTATGATKYVVEYGNAGYSAGAGTQTVVENANQVVLSGLEEQSFYDVYVSQFCTETLQSPWSAKVSFQTTEGVGIDQVENGNVALYPNPASTTVTVSGIEGEAMVTVVDMNGREVYTTTASGSLTIDVNGYAKGAYFVRVTGESTTAIRKLIVK